MIEWNHTWGLIVWTSPTKAGLFIFTAEKLQAVKQWRVSKRNISPAPIKIRLVPPSPTYRSCAATPHLCSHDERLQTQACKCVRKNNNNWVFICCCVVQLLGRGQEMPTATSPMNLNRVTLLREAELWWISSRFNAAVHAGGWRDAQQTRGGEGRGLDLHRNYCCLHVHLVNFIRVIDASRRPLMFAFIRWKTTLIAFSVLHAVVDILLQ